MSAPQAGEAEKNIEIWKVKKLIKRLESARGNGTSMISLIIREPRPKPASAVVPYESLTTSSDSPKGSSVKGSQNVSRRIRMFR